MIRQQHAKSRVRTQGLTAASSRSSPLGALGKVHATGLHERPGGRLDQHLGVLLRVSAITWLPHATDGQQLVLASSSHHKLQLPPSLLVRVGVVGMQHLGVGSTHEYHLHANSLLAGSTQQVI